MTPIIAFINPDPAHPERCGECRLRGTLLCDGKWDSTHGPSCTHTFRGPACLLHEKLMRDLLEAAKEAEKYLWIGKANSAGKRLVAALAAIDAAGKEQG